MSDLHRRIWAWLPARSDRRRNTIPSVVAAEMGITLQQALDALHAMEREHHAKRDRERGRLAQQWHRGIPYPPDPAPEPPPALWEGELC